MDVLKIRKIKEKNIIYTWQELNPNPSTNRHHEVVVQMQEGDLSVLLPQHEEHRIQELNDFRHEVPPYSCRHLKKDFKACDI